MEFMDSMIEAMRSDLVKIKRDAEEAQSCLVGSAESPAAAAGLRRQVDELAEELLNSQQLLGLKTSGRSSRYRNLKVLPEGCQLLSLNITPSFPRS